MLNPQNPRQNTIPEEISSEAHLPVSPAVSFRLVRSVLVFAVVGIVIYAAATLASDYRTVAGALLAFPIRTLGIVVMLVLVGWLLRAWRFHYYLQQMGEDVPLVYSIQAFLAGFALTGTPGKMGEAVKGVFLKQDYGVSITRVVGILLVERLMDLWGVLFLGSFSLLLFEGWRNLFLLCAGVVVAGGAFVCMERLYRPFLEGLARISFLSWGCMRILNMLLTGKDLMTPTVFFVGLLVSAAAWGMESVSMYLIMTGFELPTTLLQANFIYCFSTLVGALSMLPGGIGGTEAGMIGLLAFIGIPYNRGLPAVILIRLCTLWLAVIVGVGFMAYLLARSRISENAPAQVNNSG